MTGSHRDADLTLESPVTITQTKATVTPQEVAQELGQFWDSFWNANSQQSVTDLETWPECQALMSNLPSLNPLDIQVYSIEIWKQAIADIKSNTARGVCGRFADELKLLPEVVLADLIGIFRQIGDGGLPDFLMHAKTVPLAKEYQTKLVSKTRPITILSLLYRVWGKVVSRQILQQWTIFSQKLLADFCQRDRLLISCTIFKANWSRCNLVWTAA